MLLEPITLNLSLNAPVERVWQAWTVSDEVARWFAEQANVVAERGGPYELFWEPAHPERNSTLGCRITILQPQAWLGFTWRGPALYDEVMNENASPPPPPTHVRVGFAAAGEQTAVRILHSGWGSGPGWSQARTWHIRSWDAVCSNLAACVDGREIPFDWKLLREQREKAAATENANT